MSEPARYSREWFARRELLRLMRDLSEDFWCAGWDIDLAHNLWRAVEGNEVIGLLDAPISEESARDLRDLSHIAGGWWVWGGEGADSGPRFVTTEEWERIQEGGDDA